MKLTTILMVAALLQASAAGYAQRVSLSKKNAPLEQVFWEISNQSGYEFFYDIGVLKETSPVNLQIENVPFDIALKQVFANQPLTYVILKNTIIVKRKQETGRIAAIPQVVPQQKITGKVTDENGRAIPGATVKVKSTSLVAVTDSNGQFSLPDVINNAILEISYLGFVTQEIAVKGRNTIVVQLQEENRGLNEVVVVGYGTQKKATLTGAVSSLSTKELLQSPQANVSNMLVGRLPGLIAVQRSGEPGNDQSTLRIRGSGTFTGADDPLVIVDGIERANYNNIDPNEIESFNILKDASATAVYGVRGANGVVIITTRRGKKGSAPSFSYSGNVAMQNPTATPNYLNSYEYAQLYNEALKNDKQPPAFTDEDIALYKSGEDPIFHPNTNWIDIFLRDYSLQTQHNMNVSGGTERVQYFVSAGYFDQQGIYDYADLNPEFSANARNSRYNFRSNLDFTITSRFTANVQFAGQMEDRNYPGNSASNIWRDISWTNPLGSPGMIDGKVIRLEGRTSVVNPFWSLLSAGYLQGFRSNMNSSVRLNHELDFLTKGLTVHGTFAYDSFYSQNITRSKSIPYYIAMRDPADTRNAIFVPQQEEGPLGFTEALQKNKRIYSEVGLNYKRSFNKHTFTGLALYNQAKYSAYDPASLVPSIFLVPEGIQGAVGRVTYNYDSRYIGEFNMGYNGSENFIEGKRFGFFPAYSLGWVLSEEAFFPKNKLITFLKIRGSYGEVGNDKLRINNQPVRFLYLPSSYGYYAGAYHFGTVGQNYQLYQGSREDKIGNPDLTWERARKSNIGLEANLFSDKLTVSGDYFMEKRGDILARRGSVPNIVGAELPAYNLGRMKNSGWETDISFNDKIRSLNYWVKANYTYVHNKIQFMDEAPKTYAYQNLTGNRLGQLFGLLADGLYNTQAEIDDPARPVSAWGNNNLQPGDIRYTDVNKDGKINADDRVPIGYSNMPEKIFGLSFGGNMKGFDFSLLFQGADNVSIQYFGRSLWPFINGQESAKAIITERWTPERYANNEPINFPRLSMSPNRATDHNFQESTYWTRDASYVRLKNAEIGYTFNNRLLKRIGLSSVRVFANGANLLTWTDVIDFDPESLSEGGNSEIYSYPMMKTYNMGFNIKF